MSFDVPGGHYDRFMGRFSRPLAEGLTEWLGVSQPQEALDVGCGPGAWTGALVERLGADHVAAIDPSAPFVEACRANHPGVRVQLGEADALPFAGDAFDLSGANLVVHFMADPIAGLAEMARVTRPGGWVAATGWDLAGGRAPMAPLWRALAEIDPHQVGEAHLPGGRGGQLEAYAAAAGLSGIESQEIGVSVHYPTFEDWWEPYLHAVGPVGEAVAELDPPTLERLRELCRAQLGNGDFTVDAVAYAVRGRAA